MGVLHPRCPPDYNSLEAAGLSVYEQLQQQDANLGAEWFVFGLNQVRAPAEAT